MHYSFLSSTTSNYQVLCCAGIIAINKTVARFKTMMFLFLICWSILAILLSAKRADVSSLRPRNRLDIRRCFTNQHCGSESKCLSYRPGFTNQLLYCDHMTDCYCYDSRSKCTSQTSCPGRSICSKIQSPSESSVCVLPHVAKQAEKNWLSSLQQAYAHSYFSPENKSLANVNLAKTPFLREPYLRYGSSNSQKFKSSAAYISWLAKRSHTTFSTLSRQPGNGFTYETCNADEPSF